VTEPIVDCRGLFHIYKNSSVEVVALQGLDLRIEDGEMVAIVGRSGSGKTTLLNVLAAMEVPSAGTARVAGFELTTMTPQQKDRYRREAVGYLWQNIQLNLVPELSASANVQFPMLGAGVPAATRRDRASGLLEAFGIHHRANHRPSQLSLGENQRLGLAVALANRPRLLLADEPTSQLDRKTAGGMLDDLRRLQRDLGTSVLLVTHDRKVERHVDRVVAIRDGRTSTETRWRSDETSEELVIMDRAGRIQIPSKYVEKLGLTDRVRVRLEDDKVIISREEETSSE
jgi:ABC-type lipoprotein export system ATPase subunit